MKPPIDSTTPDTPKNPQTAVGGRPSTLCSRSSDTPETDAKMFTAWRWDTHKMDYVPHGIAFPAELARNMERERDRYRHALRLIADTDKNPEGWASDAQIARHYLSENASVEARP